MAKTTQKKPTTTNVAPANQSVKVITPATAIKPVTAATAANKTVVKKPTASSNSVQKPIPSQKSVTSKVTENQNNASVSAKKSSANPVEPKVVTKKTLKTASPKTEKVEKTPKLKMERDSFTMPKAEYAQLATLKERLFTLGQPVKKSELLRAGIMQLTAMTDSALKTALSQVPTIKTGRPNKK